MIGLVQSDNWGFFNDYGEDGAPLQCTASYGTPTTADSLLLAACGITVYREDGFIPVMSTPSTPGFIWQLGATILTPVSSDAGGYYYNLISLYYIENADSMASDVVTTLASNLSGLATGTDDDITIDLIEWNGASNSGVVDSTKTATGDSTVQSAGNIVTTQPDLIFVMVSTGNDWSADSGAIPGAGYT